MLFLGQILDSSLINMLIGFFFFLNAGNLYKVHENPFFCVYCMICIGFVSYDSDEGFWEIYREFQQVALIFNLNFDWRRLFLLGENRVSV